MCFNKQVAAKLKNVSMAQASEVDFPSELTAEDYDIDLSIRNELQVALTRWLVM